jgi:hypothetical protein
MGITVPKEKLQSWFDLLDKGKPNASFTVAEEIYDTIVQAEAKLKKSKAELDKVKKGLTRPPELTFSDINIGGEYMTRTDMNLKKQYAGWYVVVQEKKRTNVVVKLMVDIDNNRKAGQLFNIKPKFLTPKL